MRPLTFRLPQAQRLTFNQHAERARFEGAYLVFIFQKRVGPLLEMV